MSYPPTRPPLDREETSYTNVPLSSDTPTQSRDPRVGFAPSYDAERAQAPAGLPYTSRSRNSSWDLLAGIKKFEHSYEEFDSRNASQAHLAYADGDIPKNKASSLTSVVLVN